MLLRGESGTGKELVARAIHAERRSDGPFVAINCAAIPDNLLETELFGHEKGAFTGAVARKPGKFERPTAARCSSTRSATCRSALQAKLLRVLEERRFERVGGTQSLQVDVRFIAATNKHLGRRLRRSSFARISTSGCPCTDHDSAARDRRATFRFWRGISPSCSAGQEK